MSKDGGGAEAGQDAGKKDENADIYESEGSKKKIIRLLTVMAYMFSVSFVAIVLSAYYLFLWEPPNPRLLKKPVSLSGEPELEYLLGDPPIMWNETNELEPGSIVNTLPRKLAGRIVDDTPNVDFVGSGHLTKHHGKLRESLFLLGNTLMEYLHNRRNDSTHDRDSRQENRKNYNATEYASLEAGRRSNLTGKSSEGSAGFGASLRSIVKDETTTKGAILSETQGSKTLPILVTPTIINIKKPSSASAEHSMEGNTPVSVQIEKIVAIDKDRRKNTTNKIENGSENTQNSRSFDEKYRNFVTTSMIINKLNGAMTAKDEESFKIEGNRDRAYSINRLVNNQARVNSSRDLEFVNRLKLPQRSNISSTQLTNVAINFTERKTRMQLPRKMSAQGMMARISRTLGNRKHKTGNEIRLAGYEIKDKLYEPKRKQKLVRVLTVVAYVIFVSMAAILLSLYYTFLWDPKDVSVKIRTKPECVSAKLSNPLITPSIVNETQTEKMTAKPVTMENEQTLEPDVTTQRQKDLLTILMESTSMSSSSVPSLTITEDFRTDPSIESEEMSTKTSLGST